MPKVSLLEESRPHSDHYDSMISWLLRGLAGLAVAAGHLRARVYPGFGSVAEPTPGFQAFAFLTGYAHLALVVLFVLSGWLVGGGMLDPYGSPGALRQYALKRLTRLWIVLIPAYTAMLLFAAYAAGAFIGNLLGLQTLAVPRFGGKTLCGPWPARAGITCCSRCCWRCSGRARPWPAPARCLRCSASPRS